MEKKGKTVKNSKKDPLGFRVRSKTGSVIKNLVLSGIRVKDEAERISKTPGAETSIRAALTTVKNTVADLPLEPGTFSGSRGIEVEERNGVYRIKDEKLRKKLRKLYKEFYAPEKTSKNEEEGA